MAIIIDPPNSVWPNGLKVDSEGYVTFYPLGTNKVDITTITWPKGDKLVSPFVYESNKLVGFVDTEALITSDNTMIYLPYEHIEADFSSIEKGSLSIHAPKATTKTAKWSDGDKETIDEVTFKYKGCTTLGDVTAVDANYLTTDIIDGVWSEPLWDLEQGGDGTTNGGMFYNYRSLTSFSSDLPNLTNGSSMFYNCRALSSFASDLSSLTNGSSMFYNCTVLTSFNGDLSSLTNGYNMFNKCRNLTSFTSELPNLTNGNYMFMDCTNLTSFSSNLSNLTTGYQMFYTCSNLTSFSSDLSSLENGHIMFQDCSNLTSFTSDLSSLTDGQWMFGSCKLDASSVKNIIDTINAYSGTLRLGMGCNDTTEDKDIFAQEVGYNDMTSLLAVLQSKGWTVDVQYNGRPTTTYDLRRTVEETLPVFVKLEEVEEYADYTSEDGSKKYRLDWFHETTGSTEGYTLFNSLEEAIEHFNIKPIERN